MDASATGSEFQTLANDVFASNPRVAEEEKLAGSWTLRLCNLMLAISTQRALKAKRTHRTLKNPDTS